VAGGGAGGRGKETIADFGLRTRLRPMGYAVASCGMNGKGHGAERKASRGFVPACRDSSPGFNVKRCFGEADNTSVLKGDERLRHLYRGRSLVLGVMGWDPRRTVPARRD
jgi:hypothetical protein